MPRWARELQLEHCDNPYRLDLNKVTVVVDKPERPVPLKQLGSGSNWVGVHLIAYFALQHFYIGAKRPVPSFMFLDQPSQVYFPSERDEKKADWNEVNRIYQFIIDRTEELHNQLQVIIVDHADLEGDSFREFILENWWPSDKNLVPVDWYQLYLAGMERDLPLAYIFPDCLPSGGRPGIFRVDDACVRHLLPCYGKRCLDFVAIFQRL